VSAASRLRVREEGGCSPYTPGDPVNIPHDIENRGAATGNDRELNPQVSSLFRLRRRSRDRPCSTSKGGDTGSNPVGTTSKSPAHMPVGVDPRVSLSHCPAFVPRPTAIRRDGICWGQGSESRRSAVSEGGFEPRGLCPHRGQAAPYLSPSIAIHPRCVPSQCRYLHLHQTLLVPQGPHAP
jgi:hypothetical protein